MTEVVVLPQMVQQRVFVVVSLVAKLAERMSLVRGIVVIAYAAMPGKHFPGVRFAFIGKILTENRNRLPYREVHG